MQMRQSEREVNRIVAAIDETRATEHFRNPDRPNGRAFRERQRQDPAITRAKTRLRTQHYRNRLDAKRVPTTYQLGAALVMALATADGRFMSQADYHVVGRALADLQARGFDIAEVKESLRRMRNQMMDPADRSGEPDGNVGAPVSPSSWNEQITLF
jgi:hypothetical protein